MPARLGLLWFAVTLWPSLTLAAAPDPRVLGPWQVEEREYKLPAQVYPDVLGDRRTELWARIFLPTEGGVLPGAAMPVAVFLHGNHMTCGYGSNPRIDNNATYTSRGVCPSGYVVTPNHRGYDYLARNLASWGYVVVSVNANRGITAGGGVSGDSGLNLARGRLVLKHLELLSNWNGDGGSAAMIDFDLRGKLNFDEVALMGHSRGGEGMRAALNLLRAEGSPWPEKLGPTIIRAIVEIAPVDGQTSQVLNAAGVAWTVLLPLCDGDVTNLDGVRPFDRMYRQRTEPESATKSTFVVWGANHNFFNTEWQESDSDGCDDHTPIFDPRRQASQAQQVVGTYAVVGFIRAHTGASKAVDFAAVFDPAEPLPADLSDVTAIGRDFIASINDSTTHRLVDWNSDAILSKRGVSASAVQLPYHQGRRGSRLRWSSSSAENFVTIGLGGREVAAGDSLDFSILAKSASLANDFGISLVLADGTRLPEVHLSSYMTFRSGNGRNLLQSVRIAATDLGIAAPTMVTGLNLRFDRGAPGDIVLSDIRLTVPVAVAVALEDGDGAAAKASSPATLTSRLVGQVEAVAFNAEGAGSVDVTVVARDRLAARDALPVLMWKDQVFDVSRSPDGSDDRLTFSLPPEAGLAPVPGTAVQLGFK